MFACVCVFYYYFLSPLLWLFVRFQQFLLRGTNVMRVRGVPRIAIRESPLGWDGQEVGSFWQVVILLVSADFVCSELLQVL